MQLFNSMQRNWTIIIVLCAISMHIPNRFTTILRSIYFSAMVIINFKTIARKRIGSKYCTKVPQSCLPCIAKIFDFGNQSIMLHVKTQLAKLVTSQCEFLSWSSIGHCFESLRNFAHVFRLPIFGMKNDGFTLMEIDSDGILQGCPT